MNINVNFGEILAKAWKITWKFKVLWIFGILAGCGSSRGGNFNSSNTNWNNGQGQLPEQFRQFENLRPEEALRAILNQYLTIIVGVILILCVLWILFYFLGVMGKTGLIKGAAKADGGAETINFGEIWSESLPYFWRMFGLNLLVGLPFFLIVVILVVGLVFAAIPAGASGFDGATAAGLLGMLGIFIAAMCCLSLVFMVIGMIIEQAQNAIILEDLGLLAGLSRGWEVFKRNVLTIIVMALILGVIGGIIGFVISLPILLIMIPVIAGVAITGAENFVTPLLIGVACCVVYFPVLLLISGILQTYTQTAWTLTYRQMTAPAPTPAIPAFPVQPTDAQ